MKAVLIAVNAKYIHSNLGIYTLYAYSREHGIREDELCYKEYTINQSLEDIIGDIYEEKPDLIGFSCYIWNIEMVRKIARELRKVLADCMIWYGGPEISYDALSTLRKNEWVDGVIIGEGEQSFFEVLECFRENGREGAYDQITGLAIRKNGERVLTKPRERASLDEVVFPYHDMKELQNRIVYYETSRGCPYGCSYCLSSVEKMVHFRSMEFVKKELQFFLDQKVPQVKFVDRTFNCNPAHTMEIWRYIYEHDNGITNFHFELSADILTDEEVSFVRKFRPGLAQFEIGVQSTNPKTIEAIHRKMDLDRLRKRVSQIQEGRNIHQHLDLIIGLPYEDITSFRKSFNDVYAMKPDQFQVGFLKVLKGSPIHQQALEYGIVYQSVPPYEVLYTNWITYDEVRRLKLVEEMVERYYNSMQFEASVPYLVSFFEDAFGFYDTLGQYFKEKGYITVQQSRMQNYEILYDFAKECMAQKGIELSLVRELLIFDLYARENLKKEPAFLAGRVLTDKQKEEERFFYQNEEMVARYLEGYESYSWKQMLRMTHMEWFSYDIPAFVAGNGLKRKDTVVLFDYEKRNPLDHQAHYSTIELSSVF